jgi:hypothetical protein
LQPGTLANVDELRVEQVDAGAVAHDTLALMGQWLATRAEAGQPLASIDWVESDHILNIGPVEEVIWTLRATGAVQELRRNGQLVLPAEP